VIGLLAPDTERAQAGAQLLGVLMLDNAARSHYTVC
jgi:hypothetical protein